MPKWIGFKLGLLQQEIQLAVTSVDYSSGHLSVWSVNLPNGLLQSYTWSHCVVILISVLTSAPGNSPNAMTSEEDLLNELVTRWSLNEKDWTAFKMTLAWTSSQMRSPLTFQIDSTSLLCHSEKTIWQKKTWSWEVKRPFKTAWTKVKLTNRGP